MGYYPMYFDPTYILVLIGVVLSMIASSRVKTTFAKYSRTRAVSGLTGAEVAERMLHLSGIYDVGVGRVNGSLTDHYDPSTKTLNLSETVYGSSSVAAISVAAHECGHAIQHQEGYMPLMLRSSIVPIANFGATLSWPLILIGILFGGSRLLITIGVWMFVAVVAFHFITLPVEFDASARALKTLKQSGILYDQENKYAGEVLRAAALTYVASAAAMALQLLRLLLLTQRYRRRN